MKVCCISDTHMTHLEFTMPPADILIHAGDGTNMGEEGEIQRLNAWFGKLKRDGMYREIIYVPGNHDILFEEDEDMARYLMPNARVLIDEFISFEGKKIYGSPWTVTFFDWAFMQPDLNLERIWDKIPDGLDILITHGPPHGVLDKTNRGDLAGSMTLMKSVLAKMPKYHIFGHIHEQGEKIYKIEPTTFINAAMSSNWFDEHIKNPIVFEV